MSTRIMPALMIYTVVVTVATLAILAWCMDRSFGASDLGMTVGIVMGWVMRSLQPENGRR